jgi:TonB family protein
VAAALLIAFACEQKESFKNNVAENDAITVISTIQEDGRIKIEGTPENLEKYKSMFSNKLVGFEIITDSLGNTYLVEKENVQPKSLNTNEEIFFIVEEMPEFPGGEQALRQFIANSVAYPEMAKKNGVQGKVYVTFTVAKDGSVQNATIARGVDPSLDTEALRVVKNLPKWKPGKQKGEVVNVNYTVPINFKLQ